MQDISWVDREAYPFKPHYFESDDGRMQYVDEGKGEPVVLVHGTSSWSFIYRNLNKALAPVDEALEGKDYLAGEFSAADIMLGHASWVGKNLGQVTDDMKNLQAYVARLEARPGFQKMLEANQ